MSYAVEVAPLLDKASPYSPEAERGVNAALALDSRLCDEVALIIRPECFHSPRDRFHYEVLQKIHNSGRRVDTTLWIDEARATGLLERNGGIPYLLEIAESGSLAANAVWYAGIVREKYELRQGIAAATDALAKLNDPSADPKQIIPATIERLYSIGESQSAANHITASQAAAAALDGLQERIQRRGMLDGVGFPLHDVARLVGRMRPQDFAVLAALTSGGKSALASAIIEHATGTQNIPTLLVTLEMSAVEYIDRLISVRACVAGERIRDGILSDEERKRVVEHASDFEEWPLLIDDTPLRTMADITAQARMLKRQGRLEFLAIDHIGCIEREHPRQTDYEHMSRVSRRLKVLARELNIAVLGLCQINRQSNQRGDPRPKLSDIKASGNIEQDANLVMFVHRPELYAPDDEDLKGKAELHVLKNRSGRTGVVPLRWNGDTTSFQSVAKEWSID